LILEDPQGQGLSSRTTTLVCRCKSNGKGYLSNLCCSIISHR